MNGIWFFILLWVTASVALIVAGVVCFVISLKKCKAAMSYACLSLIGLGLVSLGFVHSIKLGPKQAPEISQTERDSSLLTLLTKTNSQPLSSKDVEKLALSNVSGTDEWMKLLLYRIQIRKTLMALAKKAKLADMGRGRSLTNWINVAGKNKLITPAQELLLCQIRDESHYFEWQEGALPTGQDIKDLGVNEPTILDELIKAKSSPSLVIAKDQPQECAAYAHDSN